MTAKNATTKTATTDPSADEVPTVVPARPAPPMETITLANHLNIGGRAFLPGAKVRVSPDYARRLRLSGYVARS
ncbi:hypothetical protein [Streptomyces sp. NPDC020965]|uniref:hypothetical protein n=1 Tax=Streptomyces sp. NPDC020965 TaxID=3365105 RepID=UPI0037AB830C